MGSSESVDGESYSMEVQPCGRGTLTSSHGSVTTKAVNMSAMRNADNHVEKPEA